MWHSYQDEFDKCDAICKNHGQKKREKTETYYFPIKPKPECHFYSIGYLMLIRLQSIVYDPKHSRLEKEGLNVMDWCFDVFSEKRRDETTREINRNKEPYNRLSKVYEVKLDGWLMGCNWSRSRNKVTEKKVFVKCRLIKWDYAFLFGFPCVCPFL